ncbi:MAG: hypothetical protein IJD17_06010 [Clostridia bacterium]|nr:hypothetical protein [Clostridia bacterium]
MFGYIKPSTPELRVRDNELYKSLYCGLCRTMGIRICKSARFTLSYDILFLALVRAYASNESIRIKSRRCTVHPFKKRPMAECDKALPYSACVSAILSYHNLIDDLTDEKGFKRFVKKAVLPTVRKHRKKASMDDLDGRIAALLGQLYDLEAEGNPSAEACADKFGDVLALVFAYDFGDPNTERILSDVGYHIGRWIYLIDAIDDHAEDKKSGDFNPFSSYESLPKESLEVALNLELEAAKRSLDLLFGENKAIFNIIENIIYIGMPDRAKTALGIEIRKEQLK